MDSCYESQLLMNQPSSKSISYKYFFFFEGGDNFIIIENLAWLWSKRKCSYYFMHTLWVHSSKWNSVGLHALPKASSPSKQPTKTSEFVIQFYVR